MYAPLFKSLGSVRFLNVLKRSLLAHCVEKQDGAESCGNQARLVEKSHSLCLMDNR